MEESKQIVTITFPDGRVETVEMVEGWESLHVKVAVHKFPNVFHKSFHCGAELKPWTHLPTMVPAGTKKEADPS